MIRRGRAVEFRGHPRNVVSFPDLQILFNVVSTFVGEAGYAHFVRLLCYARVNATDGFIPYWFYGWNKWPQVSSVANGVSWLLRKTSASLLSERRVGTDVVRRFIGSFFIIVGDSLLSDVPKDCLFWLNLLIWLSLNMLVLAKSREFRRILVCLSRTPLWSLYTEIVFVWFTILAGSANVRYDFSK